MSDYKARLAQKLVRDMKEWGAKKDSFHLAQFLVERDMSFKELDNFCKIAPNVSRQLEIMKSQMLVNWMHKFEDAYTGKHTVSFGMQCVKNYDLDQLNTADKKTDKRHKSRKMLPKVGSTEAIEDVNLVDDFSGLKLEGEAKDLYQMSLQNNEAEDETREVDSSSQSPGS